MSAASVVSSRVASKVGGWSLIVATVLFAAVFTYLAGAFGYPAVLDRPAAEVLPRLLSLGWHGRAVWIVYGLVPVLLIPTAIGVSAVARDIAPRMTQVALATATLSALTMSLGLLRWPSLQWHLALAFADGTPAARESITAIFDAANSYLGNFIGEGLGELFLNAFFAASTFALVRAAGAASPVGASGARRRWLAYAGLIAVTFGMVALFRNIAPIVAPVAAINNVILPIWMLILGGVMARWDAGEGRGQGQR